MNVKPTSVPTPKRLSNIPGSKLSTIEYDLCSDDDQKAIILPPSTPPPTPSNPDFEAEIQLLRRLLTSRGDSGSLSADWQHGYSGTASINFSSASPVLATFNALAAGTGQNARLSNSIINHSVTMRFRFQLVSTSNSTANTVSPPSIRFILYREKVPSSVPPTVADVIEYTSGVPTSSSTFLTSFGAGATTNANGNMSAFRSPFTFDNFHVYEDKIMTFKPMVTAITATGTTSGWQQFGTITYQTHHELHNSKTIFAGALGSGLTTNGLSYVILSDTPSALGPINAEISVDLVYANASDS